MHDKAAAVVIRSSRILRRAGIFAGIGAWLACVIAAVAASVELFIAGTFPLVPGLIAMGTYHAAIGIIEGAITAITLYLIATVRPDLLEMPAGAVSS